MDGVVVVTTGGCCHGWWEEWEDGDVSIPRSLYTFSSCHLFPCWSHFFIFNVLQPWFRLAFFLLSLLAEKEGRKKKTERRRELNGPTQNDRLNVGNFHSIEFPVCASNLDAKTLSKYTTTNVMYTDQLRWAANYCIIVQWVDYYYVILTFKLKENLDDSYKL